MLSNNLSKSTPSKNGCFLIDSYFKSLGSVAPSRSSGLSLKSFSTKSLAFSSNSKKQKLIIDSLELFRILQISYHQEMYTEALISFEISSIHFQHWMQICHITFDK